MSNLATINAYVAGAGKPQVVSLGDDAHIFHFEADGDWRNAALLFVNRNGHQFRVIRQSDGRFLFCKTWNGMMDVGAPWMTEANLRRDSAEALINLCGVGPQGRNADFESLCLLPRQASTGRRKSVWRHHMLDTGFDRADDSFTLYHPYDSTLTYKATGKPWESREAAEWCSQELVGFPAVTASAAVEKAAVHVPAGPSDKEIETALADVWGMF